MKLEQNYFNIEMEIFILKKCKWLSARTGFRRLHSVKRMIQEDEV